MKLTRTLATLCTTAAAAVILSAGGAAADDDLISALNNPAVGAACLPSGQAGVGNTVNGTQNITCAQSTDQTITNPTPPVDGGVTGHQIVYSELPSFTEPHGTETATATCPAGKTLTGGGFTKSAELQPTYNGPASLSPNEGTWRVDVQNPTDSSSLSFRAFAVCVDSAE
ncbi:hypothetical protein ACIPUC_07480 [Streptomyces sp. LARHCF249]